MRRPCCLGFWLSPSLLLLARFLTFFLPSFNIKPTPSFLARVFLNFMDLGRIKYKSCGSEKKSFKSFLKLILSTFWGDVQDTMLSKQTQTQSSLLCFIRFAPVTPSFYGRTEPTMALRASIWGGEDFWISYSLEWLTQGDQEEEEEEGEQQASTPTQWCSWCLQTIRITKTVFSLQHKPFDDHSKWRQDHLS